MSERKPEACPNCGTVTTADVCPYCNYEIHKPEEKAAEEPGDE